MVGFLVLGSTRTTMSKLQYKRVRSFISLLGVNFPAYKTLQSVCRRLKARFDFDISKSLSPLEKPCFGLKIKDILKQASLPCADLTLLQELANPYVTEHLDFMPSLPNKGTRISCLAQSKKWREGLDADLRVQMVKQDNGHFYLQEPVQLSAQRIVIPSYFYRSGNEVLAKCVYAHLKWENPNLRIEFQHISDFDSELFTTVNVNTFWKEFDRIEMRDGRLMKDLCGGIMYGEFNYIYIKNLTLISCMIIPMFKANGRIIRNVPLVLYCDDLSGNKSKQWNKHIAFYFTLAGLPPKLSNQEYNCHFVTTSNTAGALDLADPLVDDLK
ncbi:hypothetical protein DFH28DRAFT_910246 [Melampsora americana]|nr:hypothetical protein DFH28DRAFT_910246 [Melampsora americana]